MATSIEQMETALAKKKKIQAMEQALGRKQAMQLKTAEQPPGADLSKSPFAMDERYAADTHQQGVDMAGGVVEPAMTLASGMAAAPVAQIGGGIQQALSPTNPVAGFQARDRIQDFFTYKPRTQGGQEAMLAPDSVPAQVMETVDDNLHWGEEVYDATGNETLAKIVEALPSWAGAAIASLGLRPKVQAGLKSATRTAGPKGFSMTKTGRVESGLSDKGKIHQSLVNRVADPKTAKDEVVVYANATTGVIGESGTMTNFTIYIP